MSTGGTVFHVPSSARAWRLHRGLSQQALAGLARSTPEAVRVVERGAVEHLQLGTLLRIAAALEVGPADLLPVLGPVRGGAPDPA